MTIQFTFKGDHIGIANRAYTIPAVGSVVKVYHGWTYRVREIRHNYITAELAKNPCLTESVITVELEEIDA